MRYYETLFIVNPDLSDEEHAQTVERYKEILTSAGATVWLTDDWGRRRLAYEINDFSKGHYVLFEHTSPPKAITEMERNMRLDDKILRFLTVKKADTFDEEAFKARQAKASSSGGVKAGEAESSEAEAEEPKEKTETEGQDEAKDKDEKETPPPAAESEGQNAKDEAEGDQESDPAHQPSEKTES